MIPDFPVEKQKLAKLWNQYLDLKRQALLGFLNQMPAYQHHEGSHWRLTREDNSFNDSEYQEISAGFTINLEEVPELTPEKIREKLDLVADEVARQISQHMIGMIAQATDAVGNTIDANGNPFSPELFLEMLERLQLSFDEDGTWIPPTMIVAPGFWEANKDRLATFENDPELDARQTEIINRKREEWRDREACRKLVD